MNCLNHQNMNYGHILGSPFHSATKTSVINFTSARNETVILAMFFSPCNYISCKEGLGDISC